MSGLVELIYLAGAALAVVPFLAWPRPRAWVVARVASGGRLLVEAERSRLHTFFGSASAADYDDRSALRYLTLRSFVGLLGGSVLLLLAWGAASVVVMIRAWLLGEPGGFTGDETSQVTGVTILSAAIPGAVLLYLALQGLAGVIGLERRLALDHLGPSATERLQRRIAELAESRAGAVEEVDAERRRIERDLHDGVQQRVVALAMLLGRARRASDPDHAARLVETAHDESRQVLDDLRTVAWRVYPSALDTLGLADALAAVAERSPVPVRLACAVSRTVPPPVATAAYFVVSEAVTNAAKHSGATLVDVRVRQTGSMVHVSISDDGRGGADPSGGGLSGLARRVVALDGLFTTSSPPGGPTVVVAELPCA